MIHIARFTIVCVFYNFTFIVFSKISPNPTKDGFYNINANKEIKHIYISMAEIEDNHPPGLKNNGKLIIFDLRSIIISQREGFMFITSIGKLAIHNTNIMLINYKKILAEAV